MTKTLATFRIEEEDWESFKEAASAEGCTASDIFKGFVQWFLEGNRLNVLAPKVDKPTSSHLDKSLEERIDKLERSIDERIAASLDSLRSQLLEELRGK